MGQEFDIGAQELINRGQVHSDLSRVTKYNSFGF